MSLVFDNPVQPVLAMPPDLAVWQRCGALAVPAEGWRSYLHQLGWETIRPWLQEEFNLPVWLWPTPDPVDIWQVLDGLGLGLGRRRILVMLTETIDAATLQVPQEWVDIPDWAADYYVAAQADIDEQRLVLWGYATRAQLTTRGGYDPGDRTYSLSDVDLIQDFSAFWVAQQLEQPQKAAIPALPPLSEVQAERLIERLASATEPRLDLPFEQWGALLSNPRWRRQLWQQRQGIVPIDLSRWLSRVFEPGWQSLESLLLQPPALGFRSAATQDEPIVQGKFIQLDLTRDPLVLVLRLATAPDERRHIRIQLLPADATLLPRGVTLALDLPETAERLQTVRANEHDNYIQIPGFYCPVGQRFRVSVQLADAIVQEDFVS